MSITKIKYNLQLTLLAKLSDNINIIPIEIQNDLRKFPKNTITNRKDLELLMSSYLTNGDVAMYEVYKDFISDSIGQIFILID